MKTFNIFLKTNSKLNINYPFKHIIMLLAHKNKIFEFFKNVID